MTDVSGFRGHVCCFFAVADKLAAAEGAADGVRGILDSSAPFMAPAGARSGDASWRRCGKQRDWQGSARTHNRSAGSP